jgi:hypothetical protein
MEREWLLLINGIEVQASAVSEIHCDTLTELLPTLVQPLCDILPNPDPIRVILDDPVPAMFLGAPILLALKSREKALEALPASRLTVTDSRWLLDNPCPAWHQIDVSAAQVVLSQAV